MDLAQILARTVSPEGLQQAQQYLESAAQTNFADFLRQLSDILANVTNDNFVRTQAGLQFKNALTAKDESLRDQYQQRWLNLPQDVRDYIKQNVLSTLGTETTRPSTAAQCVAFIALTELPHKLWPDVISFLTKSISDPSSTELKKEGCLEAIGYICQDIDPEVIKIQSNEILTAIVFSMKKDEPSVRIKLAATNALLNSLEFTKANFEQTNERHVIMQVVCETSISEDLQVRVAGLECLVKIMSLYYDKMEDYMAAALFPITVSKAMESEHDQEVLQGIEFWSNVCDEEIELALELTEAEEAGVPPERTSKFYARGALQYLVPKLTNTLCKQDENDDEDDWNPCKAAGVCLMLLANCCEDAIIPHIVPFVQQNIQSQDWRRRDAAVMAFGSMLDGPDPDKLKDIVRQAFPHLILLMNDPHVAVRDTTAWTIGRACEAVPDLILDQNFLNPLLEMLLRSLSAEPRVAGNVCWAFNSLAEAAFEKADKDEDDVPATYILSPFFQMIVDRLLETTMRDDAGTANLRSSAYEAVMEMVKNSPKDCYQTVQKTTMVILSRLQQVLQLESQIPSQDRAQYNDLASLLCATLQSVLRKMSPADAPQISDAVMHALISMMNSQKTAEVQEDALMTVGSLIEAIEEGFLKYMEAFKPFLIASLQPNAGEGVNSAAVGLVADLSRALKSQMIPFCDELIALLSELLKNPVVHQSVKPQILSVFGDIALAIGVHFSVYLQFVLESLAAATTIQAASNADYDFIDYVNDVRENCLMGFTGIIQGLKGDQEGDSLGQNENALLQHHLPTILNFILVIAGDTDRPDSLTCAAAGLIGDLISVFGQTVLPAMDHDLINSLLMKGRKSKTNKTRTLSTWAIKEIKRLKQNTPGQSWTADASGLIAQS